MAKYNKKFVLSAPRNYKNEKGIEQTAWVPIGYATKLSRTKVICHIDAIPLNWDGKFYLFVNEE